MSINNNATNQAKSIAWEEFVEITGVAPDHLREIIALGWIETIPSTPAVEMFRDSDVFRVRKLERICGDFELPVIGGTIIVDLLERIDRLEQMIKELNNLDE